MPHSVTSILAHIRSLHAQMPPQGAVSGLDASAPGRVPGSLDRADGVQTPSFIQTLKHAMEGVNAAQQHASALAAGFERGDPGADLAQVMVAAQHSQVAFRATVEVRNRLLQAYQDVLNMPV